MKYTLTHEMNILPSNKGLGYYDKLTNINTIKLINPPKMTVETETIHKHLEELKTKIEGIFGKEVYIPTCNLDVTAELEELEELDEEGYAVLPKYLADILTEQIPKALNKKNIHLLNKELDDYLDLWEYKMPTTKLSFDVPVSKDSFESMELDYKGYVIVCSLADEYHSAHMLQDQYTSKTTFLRKALELSNEFSNHSLVYLETTYSQGRAMAKFVETYLMERRSMIEGENLTPFMYNVSSVDGNKQSVTMAYLLDNNKGYSNEVVLNKLTKAEFLDILLKQVPTPPDAHLSSTVFVDNIKTGVLNFRTYSIK